MPPGLWCSTLGPLNHSIVEVLVIFGYLDDHRFCDEKSKQSSLWNLNILTGISIKYTGLKCLESIIKTRAGVLTVSLHHHQPQDWTYPEVRGHGTGVMEFSADAEQNKSPVETLGDSLHV